MTFPRIKPLEDILGKRLDQLDYSDLADRVGKVDISESPYLDFKVTSSGLVSTNPKFNSSSSGDPNEIAKDISAFANTQGGAIVIGVKEGRHGEIEEIVPVVFSGGWKDQLSSILRDATSPSVVPCYSIKELPCPESPTQGLYLIAVGKSAQAPHGYYKGKNELRYMDRSQGQVVSMREERVREMYRSQFEGTERTDRAASSLYEAGVKHLVSDEPQVWVTLTLVPEYPGERESSRESLKDIKDWLHREHRGFGMDESIPSDGFRVETTTEGLFVSDSIPHLPYLVADLRDDGGSFVGMQLPSVVKEGTVKPRCLHESTMVKNAWSSLRLVTGHALRNCGAYGQAKATLGLYSNASDVEIDLMHHRFSQYSNYWVPLDEMRSLALRDFSRKPVEVALDWTDFAPEERVRTLHRVCRPMIRNFRIEELRCVDSGGFFRKGYWPDRLQGESVRGIEVK